MAVVVVNRLKVGSGADRGVVLLLLGIGTTARLRVCLGHSGHRRFAVGKFLPRNALQSHFVAVMVAVVVVVAAPAAGDHEE